jgi:hypothetical protein
MLSFEKLLAAGSTELPDCRCGAEMRLSGVKPCGDTEIRIFKCDTCSHEFQLMVWRTPETINEKLPSSASSPHLIDRAE